MDIRTGRLLWEWHALGHVPLSASFRRPQGSTPFDYFHLNSIQQLPDGNLLISARNTWGVYEISGATGKVLWTLGGKDSSFRMEPGAIFEWQHDARRHGHRLIVFNDAWNGLKGEEEENDSSAKVLRIGRHKVTLVHRYTHHPSVLSSSEGNVLHRSPSPWGHVIPGLPPALGGTASHCARHEHGHSPRGRADGVGELEWCHRRGCLEGPRRVEPH